MHKLKSDSDVIFFWVLLGHCEARSMFPFFFDFSAKNDMAVIRCETVRIYVSKSDSDYYAGTYLAGGAR